jgi:hypothetical protein
LREQSSSLKGQEEGMKLLDTLNTLTPFLGEAHEYVPGRRIIPENVIEIDALKQVWQCQCIKEWSLDSREVEWDYAEFGHCTEIDDEGFGRAVMYFFSKKFDPLNPLDTESICIYWLWENDKIQSYWSVDANGFHSAQTNHANCRVVFK